MSQSDTTNLAGEALEESAWSLPDPEQIAEADIMQFVESVLPRLSIDRLSRLESAARETRHSKQEEAKQSTRQLIEAQLQASGLTLRDLFPELLPGRRVGEGGPIPPKFRGPNNEAWSGRGHTPKWLTVLEATGRTRDEFRIREGTNSGPEEPPNAPAIEDL